MKEKIYKIISILLVIIPIFVFLRITSLEENKVHNINFIGLFSIEVANIIIMIYCYAVNEKKKIFMFFILIFIIVSILIPIYHVEYTYAPTGPGSEFMGLALKKEIINIYGIDISGLINKLK